MCVVAEVFLVYLQFYRTCALGFLSAPCQIRSLQFSMREFLAAFKWWKDPKQRLKGFAPDDENLKVTKCVCSLCQSALQDC